MIEPRCKKCRGWLDHRNDDFWICKKCGCTHLYIEPEPTDAEIELRNLSDRITNTVNAATSALQDFENVMRMLESKTQMIAGGPEGKYIEGILSTYRHGFESFSDSAQGAKTVISMLRDRITPLGGGYFEPVSDMLE